MMIFTKKTKVSTMSRGYTGFTLAEVLITLGIIGIVAAITVPVLIKQFQSTEITTKVFRYQSIINNVLSLYMVNNGCVGDIRMCSIYSENSNHAKVWEELKPYFFKIKDCGTTVGDGACWPASIMYKYLNGTNYTIIDNLSGPRAVFPDGTIIRLYDYTGNCTDNYSRSGEGNLTTICGWFQIDTNGTKGPNQAGIDTFMWHITKNGAYPFGVADDIYYADATGASGCDRKSTNTSAAPREGRGWGCTAKIIAENGANY